MGKLTAATVKGLRTEGRYLDGQGLALVVRDSGQRYWAYRFQRGGRERTMSFGSADDVPLAEARKLHAEARALLLAGKDPLEERDRTKLDLTRQFAEVAEAYITDHEPRWRGPRSAEQWRATLRHHAYPVIGKVPVAEISVQHVLRVLRPIWGSGEGKKPETASRVRSRIELVLDYATAMGWRQGPNPAIWRGGLKSLLPAVSELHTTTHHTALDWRTMPAFMAKLHQCDNMGARALAFLVYTAARTGEVRGARWQEIDLATGIWTIPFDRMKARKEHRVPLTSAALDIVQALAAVRTTGDLVFPGSRRGRPLSDCTLKDQLRQLGHGEVTVHGFRSTFRDWVADNGGPADAAERALAHVIGNKVRGAYERTDLLDVRRKLMADWAAYLAKPEGDVIALRAA